MRLLLGRAWVSSETAGPTNNREDTVRHHFLRILLVCVSQVAVALALGAVVVPVAQAADCGYKGDGKYHCGDHCGYKADGKFHCGTDCGYKSDGEFHCLGEDGTDAPAPRPMGAVPSEQECGYKADSKYHCGTHCGFKADGNFHCGEDCGYKSDGKFHCSGD